MGFMILFIPNGIWFRHLGSRSERYERVTLFPAVLIFITPTIATLFSLSFLPFRYNPVRIWLWRFLRNLGVLNDGQLVLFGCIIICLVTFGLGNIVLTFQTLRSNGVSAKKA